MKVGGEVIGRRLGCALMCYILTAQVRAHCCAVLFQCTMAYPRVYRAVVADRFE